MTCRFGVHRQGDDRLASSFEVFDQATDAAFTSGMTRADADAEARRRNHDTSGAASCLEPPDLAAGLQPPAANASLARAEVQAWAVLARAAQALDELHDALAHAGRLLAEQQDRLRRLYDLLASGDR